MADRFDKFTERARRVLTLAQEEAQRFNHNYIGTEHLLLGLARAGDGIAARVLDNLGVDLAKLRERVGFIIGQGQTPVMGAIGLTPRAKKVIELAVDEARRLNHHHIGTEHLLLGLVREGEGIASGLLGSLGVRLEEVRAQVLQAVSDRGSYTPEAIAAPVRPAASSAPGPALRELVRVVPIGQTQRHGGIAIVTLALELFTDGFSIAFQIQPDGEAGGYHGTPDLMVTAGDDRGGRYASSGLGGSGGGGAQGWRWRLSYAFTPALDPAAREVRVEIDRFRWLTPDPTQRRLTPGSAVPGPWTFPVSLTEGTPPVTSADEPGAN